MNIDSFWRQDLKKENIVAEYLDINLYSKHFINNWIRIKRIDMQRKGIDTIVDISNLNIINGFVDEKAQIYYTDGGLPTFAFELNYLNQSGDRIEGWLTDINKLTEFYLLLWLTSKDNFNCKEDINQIEYVLIKRKDLLDYLNEFGLNKESLKNKGYKIAESNEFRQEKYPNKAYWYTHSTKLKESPVNIIIKKSTLQSLAILKGFV